MEKPTLESLALNLDTRDYLERLSPEKKFDLIIADPMYSLSEHDKAWYHLSFSQRLKQTGTLVVFMPPENPWPGEWHQKCYWVKPTSTKNVSRRYSRFVEEITIYRMPEARWNHDRHWSNYTNVFTDCVDSTKEHQWRKPPALIERLIYNHSNPGDTVFDPFFGSGITRDICKKLGRNWVGCEIDPKYFS